MGDDIAFISFALARRYTSKVAFSVRSADARLAVLSQAQIHSPMRPEIVSKAGSLLEKVNRESTTVSGPPSRAVASTLPLLSQREAALRALRVLRRNQVYVKSQKLLALLTPNRPKKILFSVNPDLVEPLRFGFKHLPHQIEFGAIAEDCFERYDIVVPFSPYSFDAARRYAPGKKIALPLPSKECESLCNDKLAFNQALIQAGFGRYIPKMAPGFELTYPYIVKKRVGNWGNGCYIIRDAKEERAFRHLIEDSEYFSQELVLGVAEFATHILFINGRIVKALNIKYEFDDATPIKGQSVPLLQVVQRCPHLDLFARMLRVLGFEGLCCVNYKVANGQPFLLEINPRLGGSLCPYFFAFVRHLG